MKNHFALILVGFILGFGTHKVFFKGNPTIQIVTKEDIGAPKVPPASNRTQDPSEKSPVSSSMTCATSSTNSVSPQQASSHPTIQSCFDIMTPSLVRNFETAWNKKVENFLINNDFLWNTGRQRNYDPKILLSKIGLYQGQFEISEMGTKGNIEVDIQSETKGSYKVSLEGSESTKGLVPKSHFGTDTTTNSLMISFFNFNHDRLGPYAEFGFKIDRDLAPGASVDLDLYGLNEELRWVNVSRLRLKRVR